MVPPAAQRTLAATTTGPKRATSSMLRPRTNDVEDMVGPNVTRALMLSSAPRMTNEGIRAFLCKN